MHRSCDRGDGLGRRTKVSGLALAAGLLASGTAAADILDVIEPTSFRLSFDHVPFDVPTASQRIRIRNTTADQASGDARWGGSFLVTATGGSLGPGQEQFWDIACLPDVAPGSDTFFDFDWCGRNCDDASGWISIQLLCTAGLVVAPAPELALPRVFAFEASQITVPWTNPTSAPVTITGLSVSDSAFTATSTVALPQTVAPGASLSTTIAFDTTRPDAAATVDVLAGAAVIGRVHVTADMLKQIDPINFGFNDMPLGAVYTVPITVRNSSPVTRTIASVTSDNSEAAVEGLVGVTLAPGAKAGGLLRWTATTLGSHGAHVTVAFDTGRGDVANYSANVVAPTFEVITMDAVTGDGRLDFGTWRIDAPPIDRVFKIINHTENQRLVGCSPPGDPASRFALVTRCPNNISANAGATFTMRLTPSAAGTLLDAIGVAILGGDSAPRTFAVLLSARIVDHQLALSASQLAFPDRLRGETVRQTVKITNVASNSITVPVAVTGAGFALVDPLPLTLAGGASGDVTVEFQPAAAGSYTGTLAIGAVGDLDHVEVPLAGTSGPPMVTSDPGLAFGDVAIGSTGEMTLAIHNLDAARSFRIDQLAIDAAEFTVALPADPALGPGATVMVPVRFTPTSAGAHTARLSVILEGDTTPIAIVELTGQGQSVAHRDGGGCRASGSPGAALALVVLALVRRRRRSPAR